MDSTTAAGGRLTKALSRKMKLTTIPIVLLLMSGCAHNSYDIEGGPSGVTSGTAEARFMKVANDESARSLSVKFDSPPRLTSAVQPELTYTEIKQEMEGDVEAIVYFSETGRVATVEVVSSPSDILSDKVRSAVSTWTVIPPTKNGQNVSFFGRQVFRFRTP